HALADAVHEGQEAGLHVLGVGGQALLEVLQQGRDLLAEGGEVLDHLGLVLGGLRDALLPELLPQLVAVGGQALAQLLHVPTHPVPGLFSHGGQLLLQDLHLLLGHLFQLLADGRQLLAVALQLLRPLLVELIQEGLDLLLHLLHFLGQLRPQGLGVLRPLILELRVVGSQLHLQLLRCHLKGFQVVQLQVKLLANCRGLELGNGFLATGLDGLQVDLDHVLEAIQGRLGVLMLPEVAGL
uniref:Uncharacterized protein n=1 Tax=Pelodiscus sinensis TaxID=13735 RepID=K7G241_PELSI